MSFQLPRVYPLTDTHLSRLSHSEQLRRFASGGATLVQLREKSFAGKEFYEEALKAVDLAKELGVKLIINDRVDIALAVGADGVHLGQDDLPATAARRLLGENAIIGYSTHNLDQARAALVLPIDYVAIGPIFPTTSKKDTEPVLGLEGLKKVRDVLGGTPLVAIGGITRSNAMEVLAGGADSVAVISALQTPSNDLTQSTSSLIEYLNS